MGGGLCDFALLFLRCYFCVCVFSAFPVSVILVVARIDIFPDYPKSQMHGPARTLRVQACLEDSIGAPISFTLYLRPSRGIFLVGHVMSYLLSLISHHLLSYNHRFRPSTLRPCFLYAVCLICYAFSFVFVCLSLSWI